jgi:hypothetical protein
MDVHARQTTITKNDRSLSVEPARIEFTEIEANIKYIQTIVVRNLCAHNRRIRCVPPTSNEFKLVTENQMTIAPGLSISVDVEFLTRRPYDYEDRLLITAEDFKFEVPLVAKAPCASIVFEPLVNFGTVTTSRTHQKELTFRNEGTVSGTFEITCDKSTGLKFIPATGKLSARRTPGDTQKVKVELMTEEPATIHEIVEVKLEGQSTLVPSLRTLDVHGTTTNQALHVLYKKAEIDSLDFGSLYHGKSKTIQVELLNDGPTSVSFTAVVSSDSGAGKASLASSPAETVAKAEQPVNVRPYGGHVPAFGRIPLEFIFSPPVKDETTGFICNRQPEKQEEMFDYVGKIESEELGQNPISITLTGRALVPALKVKPDPLQFGECPVNDRRDVVVTLHNAQEDMPLDFSIPRVPHISVEPNSGKLAPLQNQTVVVSFTPKNLGKFTQTVVVEYCNGLYKHLLKCYGHAPVVGEKTAPVKGLEKTGKDFAPENKYVNPESMSLGMPHKRNLQSLTKIMKSNLWGRSDASQALDSLMLDLPEPTPYSLSPSAMQEFIKNKQKYNHVLKKTRIDRKKAIELEKTGSKDVDIFFENDANMGLHPGSGLKSPRYSVDDIPAERLWLQRPIDDEDGARGVTGHRYVHDENKLIKKKFKAAPTTQAEVRECSQALESWQLGLISVGPRIIDFGNVYVRSQVTKCFSVFNDLPQSILVSMQYDSEELNRSTPVSQLIPSAQPAGFDISVCSPIPQSFQRQIVYQINGLHAFKLLVKAEITVVQIKMSRSEINFRFGEENLDRTLTESLVLTNPGNAPARFNWQGASSSFSVSPSEGIIRSGQTCNCEVTFTPPNSGSLMEGFLTLKTEDGYDQGLRCSGQAPEASCQFGSKRLDFGILAVGLPADKTVSVVNNGKNVAVFHVENVVEGVTVTPVRGRIASEGRVDLNIHVLLDRPVQLESVLTLNIRGGKAIKLAFVATAVVPNIEFNEAEIEFGQLTLGAVASQPLSLKNSSAVEGTLYVNLQPYPEFSLSLADDKPEGKEEDQEFDSTAVQPITLQQYQLAIGGVTDASGGASAGLSMNKSMMGGGSGNQSPTGEDEDEEANSQIYKITVQPNYTLSMQLTYQPQDLGQHYFEFPIVTAGGGKSQGLRRVVHAEALRPRMLFSNPTLDFKTKVVSTGMQSVASVLELAVHNADDYPIEWKIDIEPLKKFMGVFHLEPNSGLLAPEQDCLVRGAFLPNEPIEYKQVLNVYISPPRTGSEEEEAKRKEAELAGIEDSSFALPPDESKPYLFLRLKGQGAVPKLTFDRREIVLPVVPLGVRSRCLFHIINEGYESLEVKYRLPADNVRIPLSINFPEGQQLGITKPKIPVELFFQASKPIAFSAKIEFLDNESGSYTLPVCGTTDNCILTCHSYIQQNVDFYTLEGDPVILKEKEDNPGADIGGAQSAKTGSVSHASALGYGGQDTAMVEFLVRWMNGNVLKATLENFPQDLISQNGRHLYEMIEFLSGKAVPAAKGAKMDNTQTSFKGDKGGKQKSKEMARINALMSQYETLLNFLKQHGALLSSVRPEHFLSCEQYIRFLQSQNVSSTRRQHEKNFYPKSIDAWMNAILQTIKVFLLNRITPKVFRQLPGMSDQIDGTVSGIMGDDQQQEDLEKEKKISPELQHALDAKSISESNVYSVAESILIRWLNFHFHRANKGRYTPRTVTCFDIDLQDSIVIATVIQSHVPNCQAISQMKYPCTAVEHFEENGARVLAALHEIGLQFPIQTSDIAQPMPKDMLLFVMFLFQNLPHYVPKTIIVFATQLGVNMMKNIELTNPSKKTITYFCHLQGSNDFSKAEDQLKIEPRQTVAFPVEYQSRFSRPVDAQIVFTARREGNVHAASMVFKLRSRCTGRKPRKTISVSAVLYEVGTVEVEMENPFNEDAEFQLNLSSVQICDADRNPVKSKLAEPVDPFHLGTTRLKVKAGGSSKITVSFLPFESPAHYTALLGFYDSKVGEFYYELFGTSSPPTPLETYKMQVKAEELGSKEIILPHRNIQMDRARQWLENRGAGGKGALPDSITYDVKLSSPFYTAAKHITVVAQGKPLMPAEKGKAGGQAGASPDAPRQKMSVDSGKGNTATLGGGAANSGKLSLEFRPKEPGVYPCTITLTSDTDLRIYQIEGTGTAPNTRCSLTFSAQARKSVTQEIPIVNPTERDWLIKPTFTQSGNEFNGPREFTAKKRQPTGQATTSYYPLTFEPDWVCDVHTQLTLYNVGTNETYEYELHGVAEEPLAEDHVVIRCEAREKTSHKFLVKNHAGYPATFEVESDLVHISGPSSLQVEGRGKGDYELTFQPLQAGQVTGCIMFRDTNSGHFTWYTCELQTLPPKPQQTLQLTCVVRQAVAVDIQLVNPLDDVVVFEVALNGDGLLGEAEFVLAPKETATYELVFSPLLPSKKKGTAVFLNDRVGEFWYDLDLIAELAPPEELPAMECELGRTAQTQVTIDNPTGQEVVLKHRSTNKINFKVVQQRVALAPLESTNIMLEYSPSSLGVLEEATIVLEHSVVGQWAYKVKGTGLPPSEAKNVSVVAQVNRPVSSTITFKNPFLEAIQAMILLETKSEKGVFSLLNKKAKVTVGPLGTVQIPFSFCPPSMTQHSAELIVSVMKPALAWTYQVQGVAEAPADSTLHTFMVQAREQLETTYALNLVGLDLAPGERYMDCLTVKLDVPTQYQALVSKCFDIQLCDPPAEASKDKTKIHLAVKFSPLRPLVCLCNLVISKASGGRWRFDVKLEATEPEVDDVIQIQSPLNKPASVAFRLCNHSTAYSEFDAFFDAESAYEFSVQPTAGVLEPAGSAGTTFIVTYKPTEYGKSVQGKLIIQTEDVYWSYLVKGTHPRYAAPVADKPKVNTRLTKEMQAQLQQASKPNRKKNFLRNNMQATNASPPKERGGYPD